LASPVSRPLFDDIPLLTASFKEVMMTRKGPIAPRLTDEQISRIFAYGESHFSEMLEKKDGVYHLRPSETDLARSVTWIKDESGINFFVHCNKLNRTTGGDQPLSESSGAEKQLSYAFSTLERMVVVSAAVKCFISDQKNVLFSSERVAYSLNVQRECAGPGVTTISPLGFHPIKPKDRKIPQDFTTLPTHKFRFMMPLEDCDLYNADPASFEFSKKFEVFHSLLKTIRSLHTRGVAHCDLKSENLLLSKGSEEISLTDFGAALKEEDSATDICHVPTPVCRDPESVSQSIRTFEGLKALDIWQAALIMSEILHIQAIDQLCNSMDYSTPKEIAELLQSLEPNWYSQEYGRYLIGTKYRSSPELIRPLIALMDRMLHPIRSERPGIDECIATIEGLIRKSQESAPEK